MLDPAAEQIQHAKKQRERIYDDDTYFVYSKPPDNTPEWAYDMEKIRYEEKDAEMSEIKYDEMYSEISEHDVDTNLTDPNLDFILNSIEMNLPRSEDLDEPGECSTTVS